MPEVVVSKRVLIYQQIWLTGAVQPDGTRTLTANKPGTVVREAAEKINIPLDADAAQSMARKRKLPWIEIRMLGQGGGAGYELICTTDPETLLPKALRGPKGSASVIAEELPAPVEQGMNKQARAVCRRLQRQVKSNSIAYADAREFLTGGKMGFAKALVSRLLRAYEAFGVLKLPNGAGEVQIVFRSDLIEAWPETDVDTVAQFLVRVEEQGEKLVVVKPKEEKAKAKPAVPPVPPTPPSPPKPLSKPAPPRAPLVTASETVAVAQALRGRGRRRAEDIGEAELLLADPSKVLLVLQAVAVGDPPTAERPLAVLLGDLRSSCLSLAERVRVLDALASKKVIALSAGRKTATILPKDVSVTPPLPAEPTSPLARLSAEEQRWFIEILWDARSSTGVITTSPVTLLDRASVLPSKEAAQKVVNAWIRAGLLRDDKPGERYPRFSFPIDPTATTLPAGDAAGAAAAKALEAQKRDADLAEARAELERVMAEIDIVYPRFQVLLTERYRLEAQIAQLQDG